MSSPPLILIYGSDSLLVETRAWLFDGAGYRTIFSTDPGELEQAASREPVDLVVLCHTLREEERRRVVGRLEVLQPSMKRLLMSASAAQAETLEDQGEMRVSAFDGPRALLAGVKTLLGAHVDTAMEQP